MAGSRKLTVEILGDAKGLGKAFSEAEGSAKSLSDEFENTEKKSDTNFKKVNAVIAGAGLAIGAFAVKGVLDFEKLGLEVGKFSDATGLSAEESSRWIEVAGDHGIASDTLEAAIGKMNKTIGTSPQAFADFGVEIQHAKDGTVDANETFLATIDRLNAIKDPAERAEAGAKLLGKGWMETAELVGKGSDSIRRDLDAVAGNKVLTDDDVGTARGLRNAFDAVGDAVDELQLSLGKNLAPAVVEIADVIVDVVDAAGPLVEIIGDSLTGALGQLGPVLEAVGDGLGFLTDIVPKGNEAIASMAEILGANESALRDAGVDLADLLIQVETGAISFPQFAQVIEEAGGSLKVYDGISVKMIGSVDGLTDSQREAKTATEAHNEAIVTAYENQYKAAQAADDDAAALDRSQAAAQRARDEQWRLSEATARVAEKARDQKAAWDELSGDLDQEQAFLNLGQQFDDLGAKWMTTTADVQSGAISQERAMRDVALEINATKQQVIDYTTEIGGVPVEKVTKYLSLIDEGKYDEVERRLGILSRNRSMQLSIEAKGATGNFTVHSTINAFDSGGVVPGPRGAARLILAHGGETVLPTHKYPSAGGGGGVTLIFNAPVMAKQDVASELYDLILDGQRRGELVGSLG